MTLIVLEKHDVPVVTSSIWYKVGSANESKGQTGISHFLEHLMFKGTKTYAKGMIDSMTAAYGGHNNAATSFDYTMYYFNFSSDRWQLALEIEADRMAHCVFDADEFDAERKVVLEELKRQLDSPWGRLAMQVESAIYPNHPYYHPVIGWQDDLERITREDVMAYYRTYYVPNNAILIVVGDIDTEATIELVRQQFAHIPPNPLLPELRAPQITQQREQRVDMTLDTHLKRIQIAYYTTTYQEEDTDALEVIDYILSHGKTSRLYQRLIEQEQLVGFIDTFNHPRRFPGVFYLFATLHPGVDPEVVERAIHAEVRRLQTEPLPAEELQKVKNTIAADFIFEKETTSGLAHSIGEYETLGSYTYINTHAGRLARVTAEDIMRVAQTYLTETHRTTGWIVPEDPEEEYEGDDMDEEEMCALPLGEIAYYTPPTEPEHDNVRPVASSVPHLLKADTQRYQHHRWTLENGLTVLFLENHVLPVLSIEAFVEAGQRYETDEQAGIAVLTGMLLDEGTTRRSGFEIAEAIEAVGGSLDTETRGASAQVLSKDMDVAMDLLSDVLIRPDFEAGQLDKKRQRLLASIEGDEDHLSLLAYNLFRKMVYGKHPYHRSRKGYKETLSRLTRADVQAYHAAYFRPNNTILSVVGDAEPQAVFDTFQRYFAGWEAAEISPTPEFVLPTPSGCVHQHLEKDREQSHLYLGHAGITRMNSDFYTLFTMDHILGMGAGFTDRISRVLRDQEGLAYTVSANISLTANREPGVFAAYIGTSPQNMPRAIECFLQEIRRIRTEPVTQDELDLAKDYITGSYVFNFETGHQLARYLINVEQYQLGEDFIWDFPSLIEAVTIEDIQRVAQRYLDPDNYYIASVGKSIEPS